MKRTTRIFVLTFLSAVVLAACKKDKPNDPLIPNEEEVITTLNFTLTPEDGGAAIVWSFTDLDGDGGNDPVIESPALNANTVYHGSLELLNELEDPVGEITEEIIQEAEVHQFFYVSDVPGLTVAYDDVDANGFPIGLSSVVTTTDPGTGTLTIILRHEPDKTAQGVQEGDVTNAGGETDIEVVFDVEIN